MGEQWDAIATLVDTGRRALFEYVQRAGHPVSREEAAAALGISRGLAAFHLDKLVDAGLLRTGYQAPAGLPRGRGRTPKVYHAVDDDLAVSVPEREYALAAMILADAIADDPADATSAVRQSARRHGLAMGARLSAAKVGLIKALEGLGFHPRREVDRVLLDNCPFHALAQRQTELVCGLNVEFVGTRMATLAPRGRIRVEEVDEEIARLRESWKRPGSTTDGVDDVGLEDLLGEEVDPFDRVQLAHVVAVCRRSRTLSEAGRELFCVSRKKRAVTNDADRLKKYLAKFGLDFERCRK